MIFTVFLTYNQQYKAILTKLNTYIDNNKMIIPAKFETYTMYNNRIIKETRKRFSEKPIVAFTNSTVFILDYM